MTEAVTTSRARPDTYQPAGSQIIFPENASDESGELSLNCWGYLDTRFLMDEKGMVTLTGNRYSLCGQTFDKLHDWAQLQLDVPIDPGDLHAFRYPIDVPSSRLNQQVHEALATRLGPDNVSTDDLIRLRRGHGHSQADIWAVNYRGLTRIPDAVVWPRSAGDVQAVFEAASAFNLCLLPFGGGTNVTSACVCPQDEQRPIISLDMSRMNEVRWIDEDNGIACIEAGATGARIDSILSTHGYTLGHEPDSYELSTLGGWISTFASGMKKSRYGNIEDIVIDFQVVTAAGPLLRFNTADRESIGFDFRRLILGSEGRLGVITCALVKVQPLPERKKYDSLIFPDFEKGLAFFHELARHRDLPASIRLMENKQFLLGQCLKPSRKGFKKLMGDAQKFWLSRIKGYDLDRIAACTLALEGSEAEVSRQYALLKRLAPRYGGLFGGEKNGLQGYMLTFSIAYLRDFLLRHWIIAESFETTVPWSGISRLCHAVCDKVNTLYGEKGLPGKPFISYRLTQAYHGSACIYFYMGFYYQGVENPDQVFAWLEHEARACILEHGGTLSHHHGIGRLRQEFLGEIMSSRASELSDSVKTNLDPDNLLLGGWEQDAGWNPAKE